MNCKIAMKNKEEEEELKGETLIIAKIIIYLF
jgi:hypothetical protein